MGYFDYKCVTHGDVYTVKHSVNQDKFKTMKELRDFVFDNSEEGKEEEIVSVSDYQEKEELCDECFGDECGAVERLVSIVPVHFKGQGWPSKDSKALKYPGKNKRMYERMRNDRLKRRDSGNSQMDVIKSIGLDKHGITDTIVPNKKWDALTKEQQKIAHDNGFRPSRNFRK